MQRIIDKDPEYKCVPSCIYTVTDDSGEIYQVAEFIVMKGDIQLGVSNIWHNSRGAFMKFTDTTDA